MFTGPDAEGIGGQGGNSEKGTVMLSCPSLARMEGEEEASSDAL